MISHNISFEDEVRQTCLSSLISVYLEVLKHFSRDLRGSSN